MEKGALTKAEMAERLFDELGVNKREAKELLAILTCVTKNSVPAETPRQAKRFPSRRVG